MYKCGRCDQIFKDKGRLVQHLHRDVPCDLVCNDCGERLESRSSYFRHRQKKCEPVNIERKMTSSSSTKNNVIDSDNNTIQNGNTNTNVVNNISTPCININSDDANKNVLIDNTIDVNKGIIFNINIQNMIDKKRNIQKKETLTKDLEYVYLLWTRECKRLNEPTYKIGRTSDRVFVRMEGYDKNSELILCLPVKDGISTENYLKKLFKEKYTQKLEYGYEYFYGDHEDMCKDMILAVANELQ